MGHVLIISIIIFATSIPEYNTEIRPFFNTKTGQRILASGPSTLMT